MAQGGYNPPPGGMGGGGYPPQQQYPGAYPPHQPPQHMQMPPIPPGVPATVSAQDKGFFAGLFDFTFETFVALKVIKVLYGLFLVGLALATLGGFGAAIFALINGEILQALLMLVALPFAILAYLILGRVYFELIMVAFKIAEDADEIARNTRK